MKFKFVLSILLIGIFYITGYTQNRKTPAERKEKIQSMQVAYITDELDLTVEESQKFWPVYNDYREKLKSIRLSARPGKKIADMTDKEAEQYIQMSTDASYKEADLYKLYVKEFLKVLPAKKVALLDMAENNFKRELINNLRQREKGGK